MNTIGRWLRHLWLDAADARRTLTPAGLHRLEQAVRDSEARHLGELRLCVEAGLDLAALRAGMTPRRRAIELFSLLKVWDTELNNGVLIYLLLAERRIEILADRGLHRRTDPQTWQLLADRLASSLQAGQFEAGLLQAVHDVGEVLKRHFPIAAGQKNLDELPNAVVVL